MDQPTKFSQPGCSQQTGLTENKLLQTYLRQQCSDVNLKRTGNGKTTVGWCALKLLELWQKCFFDQLVCVLLLHLSQEKKTALISRRKPKCHGIYAVLTSCPKHTTS